MMPNHSGESTTTDMFWSPTHPWQCDLMLTGKSCHITPMGLINYYASTSTFTMIAHRGTLVIHGSGKGCGLRGTGTHCLSTTLAEHPSHRGLVCQTEPPLILQPRQTHNKHVVLAVLQCGKYTYIYDRIGVGEKIDSHSNRDSDSSDSYISRMFFFNY